jgi:hypothetical protein
MLTPSEREKLDYTFIEALDISPSAISSLRSVGIITVGDCLDFLENLKLGVMVTARPRLSVAMFDEVEPRLVELGYLPKNWRDENVQF